LKRTSEHELEYESRLAFRNLLPKKWIVRDKIPDYAIDMEVEIVEEEKVTNKVLWVQIKATKKAKRSDGAIHRSIKTKYLEYYERCHLPVIILLWVKCENSFHYLFAQRFIQEKLSVKKPDWRKQKTNTIQFPSNSKLENVDTLNSIATEGYLYITQQELNIKPETKSAIYWLDGIPKSDNKELKELTLRALSHMKNERYHAAVSEFENILRVCTTSPTEKMSILLNLGNAHHLLGQNDKALNACNTIRRLAKKTTGKDALEGETAALANIGLIYRAKGDLDKALKHLTEALKIDREIGYRQGEANQLTNIGLVYSDKGDLDKALKHLTEALKILNRFNLLYGRDVIQNAINSIKKNP